MDQVFAELFEVDSGKAFSFFLTGLREVTNRKPNEQMFYVATILAHYAQTPRFSTSDMPPLEHLEEVFEEFVLYQDRLTSASILETGGAQIILYAGFFRDQMKRRHNVEWYDEVGRRLYYRASRLEKIPKKRDFFEEMADDLPKWNRACMMFARVCRENADRLLIRI